MRIVQANVIYGHGSTGKIVEALHNEYLRQGHESFVLFGRGENVDDPNVKKTGYLWEAKLWRFIQLFTGNLLSGSPLSTWRLKRSIRKLNPEIVHLHLINGNMCNVFSLIKWLKKHDYKTVLTHHAKLMFTGGCGINLCNDYQRGCGHCPYKKEVFGKAPDRSKRINKKLEGLQLDGSWIKHTYVSPWLMSLALKSPLLCKADNRAVFNPIDTSVFNADSVGKALPERPYAFFPTSVHSGVKGWQWIELLGEALSKIGLDLFVTGSGNEGFNSSNIVDTGHISDRVRLADYYRQASATLVLSQFESFSMPVVESLCCGTPVVGFLAGGPESIETKGFATFLPQGDVEGVAKAIAKLKENPVKVDAKAIQDTYSADAIANQYLDLYQSF